MFCGFFCWLFLLKLWFRSWFRLLGTCAYRLQYTCVQALTVNQLVSLEYRKNLPQAPWAGGHSQTPFLHLEQKCFSVNVPSELDWCGHAPPYDRNIGPPKHVTVRLRILLSHCYSLVLPVRTSVNTKRIHQTKGGEESVCSLFHTLQWEGWLCCCSTVQVLSQGACELDLPGRSNSSSL